MAEPGSKEKLKKKYISKAYIAVSSLWNAQITIQKKQLSLFKFNLNNIVYKY